MRQVSGFLSGLVFGLGLILAGMTDPRKVKAFLDLAGAWDPSLALVMGGAIAVGAVAFARAAGRQRSWTGDPMEIPTDNAIAFGPGMGSLLLGTNFGAIVRDPTGALSFICEMAVTGFQQSVDAWLWLPSGEVFAAVTKGGFVRGII